MEDKMDEPLIPNEIIAADDALETPQPQQESPPVYSMGPPQPQDVNSSVQQGYVIKQGSCSGRSERFKHSIGTRTGSFQIFLGIKASIVSGITIHMYELHTFSWVLMLGSAIICTVFFFLPAGILGIFTKNKSTRVIVAYLVMSLLSAVGAVNVIFWEIWLAISIDSCSSYGLYPCSQAEITALACHSIIAILMIMEFVVAIVASAICCGGLCSCCPGDSSKINYQTMAQYPSAHTHHAQTVNRVV